MLLKKHNLDLPETKVRVAGRHQGSLNHCILQGARVNKYAIHSLTFRGLAVMLVGYLLAWLGYSVDSKLVMNLVDALSAVVFATGAIAAAKGRIRAYRPIIGLKPFAHGKMDT